MDQGGTYRCEGTTADGAEFVRFVSIHRGSSALAYFRVSCTAECIDLLRVKIFRCDAKGLPLGRPLVTWEKPGR